MLVQKGVQGPCADVWPPVESFSTKRDQTANGQDKIPVMCSKFNAVNIGLSLISMSELHLFTKDKFQLLFSSI